MPANFHLTDIFIPPFVADGQDPAALPGRPSRFPSIKAKASNLPGDAKLKNVGCRLVRAALAPFRAMEGQFA
ncbi:hypothetical protein JZU69_03505, partial [bacterium]|nr:hypothetical protein [bacterium]